MKKTFPVIFIILFLLSCKTADVKENEMKFTVKKIVFNFKIGDKTVKGSIENINDRFDLMMNIGNDIMAGEISKLFNNISYSLIYRNEFVKGTFSYDPEKKKDRLKFNLSNKKFSGDITYADNSADAVVDYDGTPIMFNWSYDAANSLIKWNFNLVNKNFTAVIKEKAGSSEYSFNDISLEDYEIILFVIFETRRMMK